MPESILYFSSIQFNCSRKIRLNTTLKLSENRAPIVNTSAYLIDRLIFDSISQPHDIQQNNNEVIDYPADEDDNKSVISTRQL